MNQRRAKFWLLALPCLAMVVVATVAASESGDPFEDFPSEFVDRSPAGSGLTRTTRSIRSDLLSLAETTRLGDEYTVAATFDHRGLVFTSKDPRAKVPTITLRAGKTVDAKTKNLLMIAMKSSVLHQMSKGAESSSVAMNTNQGTGWTTVETLSRPGLFSPLWYRLQNVLNPKPKPMFGSPVRLLFDEPSQDYSMAITAYLARRRTR